ncbi:zinc finger and BTB domain-containing protein 49 isoform X1 [Grammomys surdaster]|uniref:zinc finger and BTB domain-containing protein 49 isoform X1 n=1 Tax=Grammomys surdaster TaxID=491861 RepID=UPI0010A0AD9D|nr:zinc finger and BTB domain-containing protein 49 isoform X1 [Grammomys surdaster]
MDPVAIHSCHLLQQLREQRIQGLLCDCMLVVRGVCFKAHKNVLAAFSQYFRSLFQNAASQKIDIFHLDVTNVSGIGQILDFMYTSRLDLNQDNIQVMLDTARCLQVQNVLNLCHTFLKSASAAQLPGLPCAGGFSLQSVTLDGTCAVSEHYPPHSLQECPVEGAQPKVLAEVNPRVPSADFSRPTGEVSKPDAAGASCPELPCKQPNYYKLRTLYSKQYYKQTACPNQVPAPEQPLTLSASTDLTAADSQPPVEGRPGVPESPEHLPSTFMAPPVRNSGIDSEADTFSQPPAKQMRLKKAMHLKKLNFLKSQQSAECTSHPESDNGLVRREESAAKEDAVERAGSQTTEEKGREELGPESSREEEMPEAPASWEDPSQALQSQKQYACELCGKPFKHPSNLELHKRSHTGEKPFECNICGKHFSQAGNLQTHLRRHSGEKPYICEICGKRFAASGDVQRHIIIHSGEKPHLCDTCGRGFSNFSNLKEHKKTHTADKVFTCDECGKSFNMQRKLVKHRVRHTGERPYSCPACGKCFGGSGDLRRHVRTHTGEKPYSCEICSKCFTRSAVLRRHKRMHGRAEARSPAMLGELSRPSETSDLDKSQSSDSFSQDASVTLMPVSVKLPVHPVESSVAGFDGHCSGSYCKLRSMLHPPSMSDQEPTKLAKPPELQSQSQAYTYSDVESSAGVEQPQADGMAVSRSSLATLDNHCTEPLGSRAPSVTYRNSEGQFFSSMTLWGLAMKTLQNEHELEQ